MSLPLDSTRLERQLEELNLLKCSLMQGEQITFTLSETDTETWNTLLESYPDLPCNTLTLQSPRFRLTVEGSPIHFEVDIPSDYNGPKASQDMSKDLSLMVSVRGDQISRYDQERWQQIMAECASQLSDSECVHRLPRHQGTANIVIHVVKISTVRVDISVPSSSPS